MRSSSIGAFSMSFLNSKGLCTVMPSHIRVRVKNVTEHVKLHRALYRIGCGYYTRQKLAPVAPSEIPCGYGLLVSPKGVIGVSMNSDDFDALETHREIALEVILLAPSHEELVRTLWGSTAWNLMVSSNLKRLQAKNSTSKESHKQKERL